MAIERLKQDAKCAECGALLKKGTRAKVYQRRDGTVLVYGFDCHPSKRERERRDNGSAPAPAPQELPVTAVETLERALQDIQRALWTIVALLQKREKQGALVDTEEALTGKDEAQEEETESEPLTQKDWARFWVTAKKLGFTREQLHEVFECDSLKEIIKTRADMEMALQLLKELSGV